MYSSEEEQIEAIKKWWRENGPAVIIGVFVGFGALFGWQGWQNYQNTRAELASSIYSNIIVSLEAADSADNSASIEISVDELQQEYAGTPYAALASLAGAKAAVQRDDLVTAKSMLQWVAENADQPELANIARLRLARLYIVEAEWDAAAGLLNRGYPESFSASVDELLGDLYAAQGNTAEARQAYDRALSAEVPATNRELIQIKRDALTETVADPAAEEAEPANA